MCHFSHTVACYVEFGVVVVYCCKVQVFLAKIFDDFVYFKDYTFVHNFGSFLCCRRFQILFLTFDSLNL